MKHLIERIALRLGFVPANRYATALSNLVEVTRVKDNETHRANQAEINGKAAQEYMDARAKHDVDYKYTFDRNKTLEPKYQLKITFSPSVVLYGSASPEVMDRIAHSVANQVRHHIRTSRFVQDAHDAESAEQERRDYVPPPWMKP